MSLYIKENPFYLKRSLDSVFNQTLTPTEVVLVVDGPITNELKEIVLEYKKKYEQLNVYFLKENIGLGNALNYGLEKCQYNIVMRMDTDDICMINRAEIQIPKVFNNPQISVLGTCIKEINLSGEYTIKSVPISYEDIKRQITKKNPMNHPSVVFRKDHVIQAGGYIELKLNEDYFLWLRMIEQGYILENLSDTLVTMQTTNDTYLRRGGVEYFFTQNNIYKYMKKKKLINSFEYTIGVLLRFILRVCLPNKLRKLVYLKILRKPLIGDKLENNIIQ